MQRCFTNILTEEVAATAAFYQNLLGLQPQFVSDWFVNLADADNPAAADADADADAYDAM